MCNFNAAMRHWGEFEPFEMGGGRSIFWGGSELSFHQPGISPRFERLFISLQNKRDVGRCG
jgi:hypothetical protein